MELYLIRHGTAQKRSTNLLDQNRRLTNKGKKKTIKVAQKLNILEVNFDIILTSPFLRAKETAQILYEQGLSKKLDIFPPLNPNGKIEDFLKWLQESVYNDETNKSVALVGHQPNLSNWTEKLLWQTSNNLIILKKSGIIGLQLTLQDNYPPKAELFLLTSALWMLNQA